MGETWKVKQKNSETLTHQKQATKIPTHMCVTTFFGESKPQGGIVRGTTFKNKTRTVHQRQKFFCCLTGKAGRRLLHKHKTALNDKPNRKCQTDIFLALFFCLKNIVKDNIPDILGVLITGDTKNEDNTQALSRNRPFMRPQCTGFKYG